MVLKEKLMEAASRAAAINAMDIDILIEVRLRNYGFLVTVSKEEGDALHGKSRLVPWETFETDETR